MTADPARLDSRALPGSATKYARYVGRVGALAVALGVGMAVATGQGVAIARADDTDPTPTDTSTSDAPQDTSPSTTTAVGSNPGDAESDAQVSGDAAQGPSVPRMRLTVSGGARILRDHLLQRPGSVRADDVDEPAQRPNHDPEAVTSPKDIKPVPRQRHYRDVELPAHPLTQAVTPAIAPVTSRALPRLSRPSVAQEPIQRPVARLAEDVTAAPPRRQFTAAVATRQVTIDAPAPVSPVAAKPAEELKAVQATVVRLAGDLLSPFAAPTPGAPVAPPSPTLWAVLAWVRREIKTNLFNRTPHIADKTVSLHLADPNGTGTIPLNALGANDKDGDTLTYSVPDRGQPGGPTHGTVTVDNTTGVLTYNPDGAAQPGQTDTFTVTVTDANGPAHVHGLLGLLRPDAGHTDTATITVTLVNSAPTAPPRGYTTTEDTPLTVADGGVLRGISDPDGDPLKATLVTGPANGALVLRDDGTFTYTPNSDFAGTDTFTYTASDSYTTSAPATVTINVTAVNDNPVATPKTITTPEDTPITFNLLDYVSDADRDTLTISDIRTSVGGSWSLDADGTTTTFTPAPNYNGAQQITYTVSDGNGGTAENTITIDVTPVNDPPVARDDAFTFDVMNRNYVGVGTIEDGRLGFFISDLGKNDDAVDVDGDVVSVLIFDSLTQPVHGRLEPGLDDRVTYVPNRDFNGIDEFTYTISDGNGGFDTATVTVEVRAVNDAPVATPKTITIDEDTNATVNLLDPAYVTDVDGDTLRVSSVSGTGDGTWTYLDNNTTAVFTPTPNSSGVAKATLTYTVDDGRTSVPNTITINVTPVNDPPIAVDDTITVEEDRLSAIDTDLLTQNDIDPDGDARVVISVSDPAHGTVFRRGTFIDYRPDPDFTGTDTFTYTVTDLKGGADDATVTVTVTSVNDDPVARDDTLSTKEDKAIPIVAADLLANDTDADADTLSIDYTQPANGTIGFVLSGGIVVFGYKPNPNFNGTDTFTYTVSDGNGGTDTATVTVTVDPVNDNPVATATTLTTPADTPITVNMLDYVSDADGDPITVTSRTATGDGTWTFAPDNTTATFTPTPTSNRTATLTYTVTDGNGGSVDNTITIDVNDPPVALDDTLSTKEDTAIPIVAADLLANDTDADADTLSIDYTQPANGTIGFVLSGGIVVFGYKPNPNFNGTDTFTYTVSDGNGGTDTATVTVTVDPVNDAPVANDDIVTYTLGTADTKIYFSDLLDNDTDAETDTLFVTSVTQPTKGYVSNIPGLPYVVYTPAPFFNGSDTFTYTISDGNGGTDTATVTVNGVLNNPPTIEAGSNVGLALDTQSGLGTASLDVSDADDDTLTYEYEPNGSYGTLAIDQGGEITYRPTDSARIDALLIGPRSDTFVVTVSDGRGGNATTTITADVAPYDGPGAGQYRELSQQLAVQQTRIEQLDAQISALQEDLVAARQLQPRNPALEQQLAMQQQSLIQQRSQATAVYGQLLFDIKTIREQILRNL